MEIMDVNFECNFERKWMWFVFYFDAPEFIYFLFFQKTKK